jgi:hypothetical protein
MNWKQMLKETLPGIIGATIGCSIIWGVTWEYKKREVIDQTKAEMRTWEILPNGTDGGLLRLKYKNQVANCNIPDVSASVIRALDDGKSYEQIKSEVDRLELEIKGKKELLTKWTK